VVKELEKGMEPSGTKEFTEQLQREKVKVTDFVSLVPEVDGDSINCDGEPKKEAGHPGRG
jgi:hypothetical protein